MSGGTVTKMFDSCQHPVTTTAEECRASPSARVRWCALRQSAAAPLKSPRCLSAKVRAPGNRQDGSRRPDGAVLWCGQRLPNVGDLDEDNPWELVTTHPEREGFDGSAQF
jgi:hypothetical protein